MVTSGIAPTRVSPRVSITGKKTVSQRLMKSGMESLLKPPMVVVA